MKKQVYIPNPREATPEQNAALLRWNAARVEHSQESALFQRVIRRLPPKGERSLEQIAFYEASRIRYSNASKKLRTEERIFYGIISPLLITQKVNDAVEVLINSFTSTPATAVRLGKAAAEREFRKDLYGDVEDNPAFAEIKEAALKRMQALEPPQAEFSNTLSLSDELDPSLAEEAEPTQE